MKQGALSKIKEHMKKEGLLKTSIKISNYVFNMIKNKMLQRKILSLKSNEDRFTWIYRNNFWSNRESVSGTGSTFDYTKNIRKELPNLLIRHSIKTIFDAPCGDFNWMRHVLPSVSVKYIGADIVKPLIEKLNLNHKSKNVSFVHFDLVKDTPPKVDLMICRDCLFHFSFQDTRSVLENFVRSESKYLLTTTHKNVGESFSNKDISTGDFRFIDLFSKPYRFPIEPIYVIDDWMAPEPERQICLWDRDQIVTALRTFQI